MKKFVSYEKMSKKQQREINRQKRGTWQCSPVTRIADTDKKHYSRKIKHKNSGGDSSLPLYLLKMRDLRRIRNGSGDTSQAGV